MNRLLSSAVKLSLVLSGGALLSTSTIVYAGTKTNLSASLTSGTLSITAPSLVSPFTGIVLNGNVQSSSSSLSPWSVTDATGTGNGWSVTVTGTQLKEVAPSTGFASGTSALTLPTGSLSLISSGTVTANKGSTPISTTGGPLFKNIGSVVDGGSFEYLYANSNFGLGTYTITPSTDDLKLTLNPSTTKVDTVNYPNKPTPYEDTITFSLVSSPTSTSSTSTSPTEVMISDGTSGISGWGGEGNGLTAPYPGYGYQSSYTGNGTQTLSLNSPVSSGATLTIYGYTQEYTTCSVSVLNTSTNQYEQLGNLVNLGTTNPSSSSQAKNVFTLPSDITGQGSLDLKYTVSPSGMNYVYSAVGPVFILQ